MAGKLKRGIIIVFLANTLNLALSVLRNLILPHFLSIETYADIKLYQLYISYISFAAIGFIDGMYLKYGGVEVSKIDKMELTNSISTFRWIEFFFALIISGIGILIKDTILVLTGLSIFVINITDYYKCLFQATGEFEKYTRIMNISSILLFATNIVLIFAFKCDNSIYYIVSYITVYAIIWVLTEIRFTRLGYARIKLFSFSYKTAKELIASGFLLMCGLYISNLMTGLDRWCVKYFMKTYDFALYAFAASIEGFLSFAVSPVAVTLYNYFCTNKDVIRMKTIKGVIHVFLALIISGAFFVKYMMEAFLDKYIEANNVLFILFASQFIYSQIKCFYLNVFKAQKRQTDLFKLTGIILAIGLALNLILYKIMGTMESFAIGTLLSAAIWYLICERIFPEYKDRANGYLYSITIIIAYLLCGIIMKSYFGLAMYLVLFVLLSLVFRKQEFCELIAVGKSMLRKYAHR